MDLLCNDRSALLLLRAALRWMYHTFYASWNWRLLARQAWKHIREITRRSLNVWAPRLATTFRSTFSLPFSLLLLLWHAG
mmetsp:Transcript_11209/g.19528  ORF Transcript_11209/g.19528 Transcript_11209/m.19528 type:complete len:80 (-) Transcript_11209:291-530(-)